MTTKNTIIIGGGVSGLVSAYSAIQSGSSVTLYEKSNQLGGLIGTKYSENGLVEQAANGFLNSSFIEKLTNDLNLKLLKPESSSKKRRFLRNNKLHSLPISIFALLRGFFGFCFINSEPRSKENMQEWSQRIFGKDLTEFIIEPAIGGIYSTELKQMYVPFVFSKFKFYSGKSLLINLLFHFKNKKKEIKPNLRGLVSFQNGMQELIKALHTYILKNSESKILLNSKICNFKAFLESNKETEIRVCTSLLETIELIKEWDLAKEIFSKYDIRSFSYQSICTITQFAMNTIFPYKAFGILFPRNQGLLVKGVLANHAIFKGRVENLPYSETWIYSGDWLNDVTETSAKEIFVKERILLLSKLNKYSNNDSNRKMILPDIHVKIWKNAFPIYNKNLYDFNLCLNEIETISKQSGNPIRFYGNYRKGIGLRSLIENAMIR
ncbi:MAG: FAD-dependent oxidoreductase [Leptospiraceae bacterium]|nr:FAD-dependent oxidoreductase [Leptospiraceae bacterium]